MKEESGQAAPGQPATRPESECSSGLQPPILLRRGAPGSGCQRSDVRQEIQKMHPWLNKPRRALWAFLPVPPSLGEVVCGLCLAPARRGRLDIRRQCGAVRAMVRMPGRPGAKAFPTPVEEIAEAEAMPAVRRCAATMPRLWFSSATKRSPNGC